MECRNCRTARHLISILFEADYYLYKQKMEGVPPQLFKIALNSSCDRLNVTTSLSGWLEDFAEIENLVGKSLCKVSFFLISYCFLDKKIFLILL